MANELLIVHVCARTRVCMCVCIDMCVYIWIWMYNRETEIFYLPSKPGSSQCCHFTYSNSDVFLASCHCSQEILSKTKTLCLLTQNLKFFIHSPDTLYRDSSSYEHQETSKMCSEYPHIRYKTIH